MGNRKRVIENIVSLFLVQGANYILPLLTLPYLVRILHPTNYGLITYAWAVIQYFITVTDYGFNLTATRRIAINRENLNVVSEIFSAVMLIRLALSFLGFIVLTVLLLSVPMFQVHWGLYLVCYLAVIGNAIFPIWLFVGLENMKYITILNLTAKFTIMCGIFIFVRHQNDFLAAGLIQTLAYLIPGLLSLWIVFGKLGVRLRRVSGAQVWDHLREGFFVFASGVAILSYTTYNTITIGLVLGTKEVAIFNAANKLVQLLVSTAQPILQALAPYLAGEFSKSLLVGRKRTFQLGASLTAVYILVSSVFIFVPAFIIDLVYGHEYLGATSLLRTLWLVPAISVVAYVLINISMLNEGLIKYSMYCYIAVGALNVLTNKFVLKSYGIQGLAVQYLIVEITITGFALIAYLLRRKKYAVKYSHSEL